MVLGVGGGGGGKAGGRGPLLALVDAVAVLGPLAAKVCGWQRAP